MYTLKKLSALRLKGLIPEKDSELMVSMDNSTGQNKSKVVMHFFGKVSLLYKKMILFYFIKGHTKMICDRVVALWRSCIRRHNLYSLDDIIEKIDGVKSVYPELLRNTKTSSPCRAGWDLVLSKFIRKMPREYTTNYFFSIEDGVVSFKHIATTSDAAACTFTIFEDVEKTRKNLLTTLFGHSKLEYLEWHQIALPLTSPKKLSKKKIVSLGNKHPTIPAKYLPHYPTLSAGIRAVIADGVVFGL